jgi:hypothetical protein
VTARSDSPSVRKHDEEHLRRFVAARRRGDVEEMRRWWDALVEDFFDRMDGFVALAHKGRLDDDEHELAVALAMSRFSRRLIDSFAGASVGELVNACKTLAEGICKDVQRSAMRQGALRGPSLDHSGDDDETSGARWEVDIAMQRFEQEQRNHDIAEFFAWALPQIIESRRAVLELTLYGAELSEISAQLGITDANAYQLRSRGMRDLAKLKEQFDA